MQDERDTPEDRRPDWQDGSWIINLPDRDLLGVSAASPREVSPSVSYTITHQDTEAFIQAIQSQRHVGYGFVPFIGAGFSAPSGAPLVREIEWYLQRCIFLALQDDPMCVYRWRPRTDQWPPLIDRSEKQVLKEDHWWKQILHQFNDLLAGAGYPNERALLAQGYGSAAEWRTALLFLCALS